VHVCSDTTAKMFEVHTMKGSSVTPVCVCVFWRVKEKDRGDVCMCVRVCACVQRRYGAVV